MYREYIPFKPYVCGSVLLPHDVFCEMGLIGEKTEWKDDFGERLLVGDTVKIKSKDKEPIISTVYYDDYNNWGVVGFSSKDYDRKDLTIAKMPRQHKTKYCTLVLSEKQKDKMIVCAFASLAEAHKRVGEFLKSILK